MVVLKNTCLHQYGYSFIFLLFSSRTSTSFSFLSFLLFYGSRRKIFCRNYIILLEVPKLPTNGYTSLLAGTVFPSRKKPIRKVSPWRNDFSQCVTSISGLFIKWHSKNPKHSGICFIAKQVFVNTTTFFFYFFPIERPASVLSSKSGKKKTGLSNGSYLSVVQ